MSCGATEPHCSSTCHSSNRNAPGERFRGFHTFLNESCLQEGTFFHDGLYSTFEERCTKLLKVIGERGGEKREVGEVKRVSWGLNGFRELGKEVAYELNAK